MRTKILLNDGYSVNVLELEAEGVNCIRGKAVIRFNPGINLIWEPEEIEKSSIHRILENAFCLRKYQEQNTRSPALHMVYCVNG